MKKQQQTLRQGLICYFLAISQAQQQVQQLQNQLILYPYFNPLALFEKIKSHKKQTIDKCRHQTKVSLEDFISYAHDKAKIINYSVIDAYAMKNNLKNTFTWQDFVDTILPFTPNVIRNSSSTIIWQVSSTQKVDKLCENLYKKILKTEMFHLEKISAISEEFFDAVSWKSAKKLILADINRYCTIIEKRLLSMKLQSHQEPFTLIQLRKWLELWVQINQKQLLNIARWIKGIQQEQIIRIFQLPIARLALCNCTYKLQGENTNIRSGSSHKIQYKVIEKKSKKQQLKKNVKQTKYKQLSNKQPKFLKQWCEYIFTILNSEKIISQSRDLLAPQIQHIQQILRANVLSKKKNITTARKILSFIEKQYGIQAQQKQLMQTKLGNLSIENKVLFTIFTYHSQVLPQIQNLNEISQKEKIPKHELTHLIAKILKTYCMTKSKLMKLSADIVKIKSGKKIFDFISPNQSNFITKKKMKQILSQMGFNSTQWETQVLMRHFGDGTVITSVSFNKVFELQT